MKGKIRANGMSAEFLKECSDEIVIRDNRILNMSGIPFQEWRGAYGKT